MNERKTEEIITDEWFGLYGESWKGLISDEAFAHPAKFSRALIRKIYDHVVEEGWAGKGSSVIDPFGGVALGGFDAMRLGLNWYGCELEQKFVELGGKNIALWNERFSRMPNWGTARLIQGDSRKLAEVLSAAECCVSSPPYVNAMNCDRNGIDWEKIKPDYDGRIQTSERKTANNRHHTDLNYGATEGQLGAMKEGDHSIAITSPPFLEGRTSDRKQSSVVAEKRVGGATEHRKSAYGDVDGQLGAMPEGQLCVSSPPFPQPYTGGGGINVKGYRNNKQRPGSEDEPFDLVGQRTYQSKGGDRAEGNLETLDAAGFEAAISSPPWEKGAEGFLRKEKFKDPEAFAAKMAEGKYRNGKTVASAAGRMAQLERDAERTYGDSDGQLGQQAGETFWSASRLILEQLHQVIAPGGHAVFVVKAFVRNKKIVDFPAQWAQLCEAVGFQLIHHHKALLVESSGTQGGFEVDKEIRVERKSFFRRLAEKKGSPRIDHESVLCFIRL